MKTKCPRCGYTATEHETIGGYTDFKDGDISFCLGCGEANEFRNHQIIEIDSDSLNDETREEVRNLRVGWLKAKAQLGVQGK